MIETAGARAPRSARPAPRKAAGGSLGTASWIALAAFLFYAATGGGRVVGSDEVTMFQLANAMLSGRIDVPVGSTLTGPDGKQYTKNAAGQAILALPLVAAGRVAAGASGLAPARRQLVARFVVSFFNAAITALLLGVFYPGLRSLAAPPGAALAATLLLGFTTPLWVYAKSFMAEPLQSLGLLLTLLGVSHAGAPCATRRFGPGWTMGVGVLLAISVKLSMLPLTLAVLAPLLALPVATWRGPAVGLALALIGHGFYDDARFGTPFETGYGAQATPAAYSTPLLVGLYGLLLSSGKGLLWFAPATWLAPFGWRAMGRVASPGYGGWRARLGLARPQGRAAWSAALAFAAGLALYSRFQHWAGDGSFGPRYLIPLLPLVFVPVAFAIAGGRLARVVAPLLGVLGFLVQVGGVAVYFGAEMREAGDYPYTRALEDPHFMSESHFHPGFSPIAGHWRMLARNVSEHLHGRAPRLGAGGGEVDPRLGVAPEDQQAMLHALDFWWLYLGYAGFPGAPIAALLIALLGIAAFAAARARAAARAESRAP